MRRRRIIAVAGAALAVGFALPAGASGANDWTSYTRPATYTTTADKNVPIEMSDGVVLAADVLRPDAPGRFPVLVIQTPYSKTGLVNTALGGTNGYFAQRGYAVITVDVRGTGSSEGEWNSFGEAEQSDGPAVVEWAARQPWSDGKVGLWGPSYMGLNQLLTAAQRPKHLKAIFPIVPMADGYRDITFSGGQVNVAFIPFWLGLVTAGGLTPLGTADPATSLSALASHLSGAVNFQTSTIANATLGGNLAYDGPFWATRSPLEVVDRIRVPAFITGGLHDLFQRGEPLVYERLKNRVPAHLLMGPWTHVQGSMGAGLPADGVPSLNDIALRWFDRWLYGMPTHVNRMPAVTQYDWGNGHYRTQPDFPDPRLRPQRMYLRGGHRLSANPPRHSEQSQDFLQQPLSGICTQSTVQWTAGLGDGIPCTTDNSSNERGEATYTTAPMRRTLELSGPVMARLWVTTTAKDSVLSVRVTDVSGSGKSTELTSGWLAGSFRAIDRSRSRVVGGQLLQPWHPFTSVSAKPVTPGTPTPMSVEIFPTRAAIEKGHRLRISVGPSDFPHQLPPLPQATASLLGHVGILTEPGHASYVALPELANRCRGGCKPLSTPGLIRGPGAG